MVYAASVRPARRDGTPTQSRHLSITGHSLLCLVMGDSFDARGNESVPIQLAQCWFPGLAIYNAKI